MSYVIWHQHNTQNPAPWNVVKIINTIWFSFSVQKVLYIDLYLYSILQYSQSSGGVYSMDEDERQKQLKAGKQAVSYIKTTMS